MARDGVLSEDPTSPGWLPPRPPDGERPPPLWSGRREPPGWQPPVAPPPGASPRPVASPGHAQPPRFQAPASASSGVAVAALVLGILGLGTLVISVGLLFPLTLPCSAAAWICAVVARRRLRDGRMQAGRRQASAGLVLGVLGVVLGIVAAVVWIWLIVEGIGDSGLLDELERAPRDPGERDA